jgi:hypothetical protein
MVSSVLNIEAAELLTMLQRMRLEYADDPEYLTLRAELPAEWPI